MNTKNTSPVRPQSRHIGAVIAALSVLGVMIPTPWDVASAQPAPAPSTSVATPAPHPDSPATAPPAAPASAPPVEQKPAAAAPSASAPPTPAAPPRRDEYTGPPLLLGPSKKKPTLGGYGGLTVAYSRMLHRDGVLIGGEGGMLIEHRLTVGGAGYGFSRTPGGSPASDGTTRQYSSGYGGFVLRYAVYSDIPLYASFGVLIGGGAVVLAPHDPDSDHYEENAETRGYFVVQPDASLHVNMTRWLRLSLVAGYRTATGVDTFHLQSDDVGGAVVGGNVQAGWF